MWSDWNFINHLQTINAATTLDPPILAGLAEGKSSIVEIGTFTGVFAEVMASVMAEDGRLFTIDPYADGVPLVNGQKKTALEIQAHAAERLDKFGPKVTRIRGYSVDVARFWTDESLDMVFIDGAHDYESVLADLKAWIPKVKPDGVIAGHDYNAMAPLLDPGFIKSRKHMDVCNITGMHLGVVSALQDTFDKVMRNGGDNWSTVWWADKGMLKRDDKKTKKAKKA